jgi:hypothetical protein
VRRLALVLALAAASCKPAPPPPGSLKKAFEGVARAPACAQNVPQEWVTTWPIPEAAAGRYAALFYSLDRSTTDKDGLPRIVPTAPRGRVSFSADGKVARCEAWGEPARALAGERYPPAAMELDEEAFEAATTRLLAATEAAAAAYAVDAKDPAVARAFWKAFEPLSEPALRRHYYEANPAFWEWLRREAGNSLPGRK